jgi:hypothetical protein
MIRRKNLKQVIRIEVALVLEYRSSLPPMREVEFKRIVRAAALNVSVNVHDTIHFHLYFLSY